MSPAGTPFQLGAAVDLDASGRAELKVDLRDDEALGGLNGIFFASVTGPEAPEHKRHASTGLVGGRFPIAGEPALGEPSFEIVPGPLSDQEMAAVAILDLDGDLGTDLIGSSAQGGLSIWRSDGAGVLSLETQSRLFVDGVPLATVLAPADVDGDGDQDLVLGSGESAPDTWILLAEGGQFDRVLRLPKASEGIRTNAVSPGDFDGDGDLDLFLANGIAGSHGVPSVPQQMERYRNDGPGGFTREALSGAAAEPLIARATAVGDVDGDGDLDVYIGTSTTDLLLLNDGSGHFEDATDQLPPADDSTHGARFADVDLDGDLDLLVANTMFNPAAQVLLFNQGHAQGGKEGRFEIGDFPGLASGQSPIRLGLEVADVDLDGDPDVIFPVHELGNGETPDLYINQGGAQHGAAGVYARAASFPVPAGVYRQLLLGDLDGDGDLDLVAPSASLIILGSALFTGVNPPLAFRRGDVNDDGVHDLSDALFLLGHLFLGTEEPNCLLAADIDGSGSIDLGDSILLLAHLFLGGPEPPAPYPAFGDPLEQPALPCSRVSVFQ